jgi:hypothetical protein
MPSISLFTFLAKFSGPEEALKECSHGAAFDRGLPTGRQLTSSDHVAAVQFISHLLQFDGVMVTGSDTLPDGAQQAHKLGWITLDVGDQATIQIDFPSMFHRSRLSLMLYGSKRLSPAVEEMTLKEFICALVAAFSSNALREPRRHTYGPQALPSLPESQWQNEFYRSAFQVTGGNGLWLSPEYGTGQLFNENGRKDFLIAGAKGWGIELLREGDRMEEHLQRFAPGGAYHYWIQTGAMKEYVVLDLRKHTIPRALSMSFHFHGLMICIFPEPDDYIHYEIKDHNLLVIKAGNLLANGLSSISG